MFFSFSYDAEGDVLEVIFDEALHRAQVRQRAYRLRQGIMLFVATESLKLVQLTLVNYRRLMPFPQIDFDGWRKLKASEKTLLKPIVSSPAFSAFIKLDTTTGYGHIASPNMPEMLALAA